jgi:dUTPase
VRFQKLRPGAQAPRYMSAGAAGMDLSSASAEAIPI